jgi:hypothetical protein
MIAKLSQDYVRANAKLSPQDVTAGIELGLVHQPDSSEIGIPLDVFGRLVDIPQERLSVWRDMLVIRAYDSYEMCCESLQEELIEIYEMFGAPEDMNSIIPFAPWPVTDQPAETLTRRIEFFVQDARKRLARS